MSLTAERLRDLLYYNPETGEFTWRCSKGRARAGDKAGRLTISSNNLQFAIDNRTYLCHRLAWLYMTGSWPVGEIDHRDVDGSNNRFANLRDVTRGVNQQNVRCARSNSLTGFLGVTRVGHKFQAIIHLDRKVRYIGLFPTAQAAHDAYLRVKREIHPGCTI